MAYHDMDSADLKSAHSERTFEQLQKELAESNYAINRAIALVDELDKLHPLDSLETLQRENLIIARDLIWGLRSTLDPELTD